MAADSWTVSGPTTIDIDDPVTEFEVAAVAGLVDILAHDLPTTRIEFTRVDGRPIEVSLGEDGYLRIGYPALSWSGLLDSITGVLRRASIRVAIALPRSVPIRAGSVSADVLVSGTVGAVRAKTVSGRVLVDSVEGPVRATSVSGDVIARDILGAVEATNVSGPTTLSGALPSARVETVSGDAAIDTSLAEADVTVRSVSGAVMVRRPAGSPLALSATTVSGRVVVDGQDAGKGQVTWATGAGGLSLRVATTSGRVSVLAAQPADASGGQAMA